MAKQVQFAGSVLTRPGSYTKIDASRFKNVALVGLGIVALVGNADGGVPRTLQAFTDAAALRTAYRSGDLVEAAQMVCDPSKDPLVPSGATQIIAYKVNNSTQASLVHDATFTFTSIDYGILMNSITLQITSPTGGSSRALAITAIDQFGTVFTETSPTFGAAASFGKFTIQYVGAGSACTLTLTATTLTTVVTGGPGGEALSLAFANFANLKQLIAYIDGLAAYTCTALIANPVQFDPTNLDAITTVDIRTALYTVMANNFDLSNWVNTNSAIITCAMAKGQTGPRIVLALTALAGGTAGSSANTNWTDAFTALQGVHCNAVVPLCAADGVAPDTFTFASVAAGLEAHCRTMSGVLGRDERQGWIASKLTKTALVTQAIALNSAHVCLLGQELQRASAITGTIQWFPAWSSAAVLAGMRAGAPIGEPLTRKVINAVGVRQDASWGNNIDPDITNFLINGVMTIADKGAAGLRIERGITTYLQDDNLAYSAEEVVQNWKLLAYDLRLVIEAKFIGREGDARRMATVPLEIAEVCRAERDRGVIVDGDLPAFQNIKASLSGDTLSYSLLVQPGVGIAFALGSIGIVPPTFTTPA